MTLFLSRLTLSRKPSNAALDGLLNPADPGRRMDAHHRLLWSAFTDGPDRRRDFLWRQERPGVFLTLSARPPELSDLFEPPEVRDYAPTLSPGDRLAFALRANATRTVKTGGQSITGKEKKSHVDLVMDALRQFPGRKDLPKDAPSLRAPERDAIAQTVATEWMIKQGEKSGFRLEESEGRWSVEVREYSVATLPDHRGPRKGQPQFGILDMTGLLTVTDPPAFLAALAQGFGRAKAFGCGLMLIRRA